jgi:glycosyltransferase involved in cell wall biosynthesis
VNDTRHPLVLLARELGSGGSERQLTELAKALDPNRFDVRVGYFRDGFRRAELTAAGISTFAIPVTSFRKIEAWRQARWLSGYLKSQAIQIVHTFDYPLTCYATPVARLAGVPAVLSSQRSSRDLIPPFYRQLVRTTDLIVDGIVVNCRAVANELLRNEDVARRQIYLCYNGIDASAFAVDRQSQPTDRTVVIGTVCVLRPEKNVELLVEAFSLLHRIHRNTKLLIVGSGPDEENVRRAIERCDIRCSVELRHAQSDVASTLKEINIFVLPSTSEALSNALMEAMASGCAVVASDVGGNPELVENGATGLLFRSGDLRGLTGAISGLLDSPESRERLGRTARLRIETEFSMRSSVEQMEAIYSELLEGRGFQMSISRK